MWFEIWAVTIALAIGFAALAVTIPSEDHAPPLGGN
jgi:hypothetical protein